MQNENNKISAKVKRNRKRSTGIISALCLHTFILLLADQIWLFFNISRFLPIISSRLHYNHFSIVSRSFYNCFSMNPRLRLDEGSMKARFCNSGHGNFRLSSSPMGNIKLIPNYMPRAPDG